MDKKKRIAAWMMNALFGAVGSLPLWMLYGAADVVTFVAGKVVGYRRKVIRSNLSLCFPEKDRKELRRIEKRFYQFLGDYFVETMKLGRMSRRQILSRMEFEGMEEVNRCLEQGRSVSLLLGHYGNWEWISSIPLHMPEGCPGGQIYHPLENEAADEAFLKIRSRFGAHCIRMRDTLPTIMKWRREKKAFMIGYIADQAPLFEGTHYYADFLNRDTPAMTGPERLSRMLSAPVFYCDVSRPERGRYVCRYVKITDDASSLPQFELTRRYYELLEASIRLVPHLWLWSHNRWKRTRQDFFRFYGEEEARKRLSHL